MAQRLRPAIPGKSMPRNCYLFDEFSNRTHAAYFDIFDSISLDTLCKYKYSKLKNIIFVKEFYKFVEFFFVLL
jgi:hypothetical protein